MRLLKSAFTALILMCAQSSFAASMPTAKVPQQTNTKSAVAVSTDKEKSTKENQGPQIPRAKRTEFNNSLQIGSVLKILKATTMGAGQDHNVALDPNTPAGVAAGWSNRYLGLSLEANIANGSADSSKVHTSAEDYQLRWFSGRFGAEAIYQRYKGFNQSPASGAPSDGFITEDEYSLPNLSITMTQAQFDWAYYGVSALEAFGTNWRKPTQDGLAFYVIASLSEVEISNPSPILPQSTPTDYGDDATLVKGKYQTFAVGPGISYVWQWTRLYIALFGSVQGGPQKQNYETTTMRWDNLKYVWYPQAKIAIGYDWGSWYILAVGHTHPVSVDLKSTQLSFFSQDSGLYVGTRF